MSYQDDRNARVGNEPGDEVDGIASRTLDAAVEVHRLLGPGLLEGIYEEALSHELQLRRLPFVRQPPLPLAYKDIVVGDLRPDLVVAGLVIVELKAVDGLTAVHLAQALSFLRASGLVLALLINFNAPLLLRGVKRVVLSRRLPAEPSLPR